MFKIDGSVHHNAIKNENKLKLQIESLSNSDQIMIFGEIIENVDHLGGTKNKADVSVNTKSKKIGISDKSKTNINTGSYDYVNSTHNVKEFFPKTWKIYEEGKNSKNPSYKTKIVDVINEELSILSVDYLTRFFEENVINHYSDLFVCLTDKKTETSYFFDGSSLEFMKLYKSGYKFKIKNTNKKAVSKQILLVKDNIEIETGLRIRLGFNNGQSLWISSKTKDEAKGGNTSSCLTIKIQQDTVKKIIPSCAISLKRTII